MGKHSRKLISYITLMKVNWDLEVEELSYPLLHVIDEGYMIQLFTNENSLT